MQNLRSNFFSVMYHYVRPTELTNLKYFELSKFEEQLNYLLSKYDFIDSEKWEKFRFDNVIPRGVLLTFDDGLKDHIDFVAPVLRKKGLFAIFYVSTNPLMGKPLPVHLTHYLLANFKAEDIWTELSYSGILKEYLANLDYKSFEAYSLQKSSELEKEIKRVVNWSLDSNHTHSTIIKLFNDFSGITSKQFIEKWYLSSSNVLELENMGFEIGSHTCSHRLLSNLNSSEIDMELRESKEILESIIEKRIKSFCFPFGGKNSYNEITLNLLETNGYLESLSVDSRSLQPRLLTKNDIFTLPRFDCNYFA